MSQEFSVRQLEGVHEISSIDWNSLGNVSNPFLKHEYLHGLEKYDCLSGHGWKPCHLVIYSGESPVGALPLYLRSNSYGEFVFDWAWADAYERAGGDYYPKLVTAIPFAPVIGPRLLVRDNIPSAIQIKQYLLDGVLQFIETNGLSSYHCLFTSPHDQEFLQNSALLERYTCQFHWHNPGYRDFQDFLDELTSKKRKQIKRERKAIRDQGIELEVIPGNGINDEQWEIYYRFYCATFYRRWGNPRLTLDFFKSLSKTMPDNVLLILARENSDYIAGAYLMKDHTTLFGRHWGCAREQAYLHFEVCYYRAIEYCIEHGISKLDAGVQGEHKLARGFQAVPARSYHWIRHKAFRNAVNDFLITERNEMQIYIDNLNSHLPYRQK